jgi:16S rRNA (adenine1518-N6/adenine1519-N6)-dimethyltransferase
LEIGPGQGSLTAALAKTQASIVALEYDDELLHPLEQQFKKYDNVAIQHGDIRTYDFSELPTDYLVVANIPYYLTSYVVRRFSENTHQPKRAVLLVQKEVAERICAQPGQMSILAVTTQFYFACALGPVVPAQYFTPPPKVDSQVIILTRRPEPLFPLDSKPFFRLVKAGFGERRKSLRNSLSGGLGVNKPIVEELLSAANIDSSQRAQELSLTQWYALYQAMLEMQVGIRKHTQS